MKRLARSKMLKRLLLGILNAMRSMVGSMSQVLIAWLVIDISSEALWGQFVQDLIIIGILGHGLSWGNKEYLLRAFSKDPARIKDLYYTVFMTRGPLLVIAFCILAFMYPISLWLPISLWVLGSFSKQSLQVWVVFQRKFAWTGLIEVLGLGLSLMLLLGAPELDRGVLIWVFSINIWATSLMLMLVLKPGKPVLTIDWLFFKKAAPFFLIGLSGLLASKIDLYMVNFMLEDAQVGMYQVVVGFFLLIPAATAFLIEPFIKNLYRIEDQIFRGLERKIILLGMAVTVLLFPMLYVLFYYFYPFTIEIEVYFLGLGFIIPGIINLPRIYQLFKLGKEKQVMRINFIHFGINMLSAMVLIRWLGMEGALMAKSVAACCASILIYSVTLSKN